MSNLPEKTDNVRTIMSLFNSVGVKKQIEMAMPKHLSPDRLIRVAVTAIRINPSLLECTQESLLACLMGCAQLGLEPEPFLGQAYFVPYYNSDKKAKEAQLIPGYRGLIALARRSGQVKSVSSQVVYENDYFLLQYGLEEKLEHRPTEGDRGGVKGAYVIFRYNDGAYSFDYMTKTDIDKIKQRSKMKSSGPWTKDYPEMAKKTVIRRHAKLIPLSVEMDKAVMSEQLALGGESQIGLFLPEKIDSIQPAHSDLADKISSEATQVYAELQKMPKDVLKAASDVTGIKQATTVADEQKALLDECNRILADRDRS